jgi:hypothetical protein
MKTFADLLEAKREEISKIELSSMGMPISLMQGLVVLIAVEAFRRTYRIITSIWWARGLGVWTRERQAGLGGLFAVEDY